MYRAIDAAYYMLRVAKEKNHLISNLKLQKLIYIANGYMLAINDTPLIKEKPQAWKYGPVIHSIYSQFKEYGSNPINIDAEILNKDILDDKAKEIINAVMDVYGEDSAINLVNLTHGDNTPWDIVWNKRGGSNKLFAEIDSELIKDHFKKAATDPDSVNGL